MAVLAMVAGCGGSSADPARTLLECAKPAPEGDACEVVTPEPESLDCQWDRSCGSYALCLCRDGVYRCDVATIHSGDACSADQGRCISGCDDPLSTLSCTCMDGTWQCASDCPAACPTSLPSGACALSSDIQCDYDGSLFGCNCVNGAWICGG